MDFNYLKSKEEAEGLVQDVFLNIWKNRKNLKDGSSLRSYLFTIAYHYICRFFRKKKIHDKFPGELASAADNTISLEEQMEFKFELEQVELLIDNLAGKKKYSRNSRRDEPCVWNSREPYFSSIKIITKEYSGCCIYSVK